jgi:hypothetical protein
MSSTAGAGRVALGSARESFARLPRRRFVVLTWAGAVPTAAMSTIGSATGDATENVRPLKLI